MQQLPRLGVRVAKRKFKRRIDMRGRDQFHFLQRLHPALRLLGLGRFGFEAIDERLQMRDLPLLFNVRGLLHR